MLQKSKITAFVELGKFLAQFSFNKNKPQENVLLNDRFYTSFEELLALSQSHNGWFTQEQVYFALQSWAKALKEENLTKWLSNYDFSNVQSKRVGLILAGNIPLVGFHDFLCVLISGHKAMVKTSSNDQHLIKFLANYLTSVEEGLNDFITFTEGKLEGFDAVIATGSNNTARYFDYYFKDKPAIIRKNRNSVAVLTGTESKEELTLLGEDIFRYFGLGCRNVSKLFVPKGYTFDAFFEAIFPYQDVIQYEKYANNYDYNKAVFLMSNFRLWDNGFLTLKEDTNYSSPISSVFYEFYNDIEEVKNRLETEKEQIQCIVSKGVTINSIPFGQTQQPELWDYADGVDTLAFLMKL
jgi:hypothetical protein